MYSSFDIKIDAAKKKKILQDWLKEFPTFGKEKSLAISRRVGPILISIGFEVRYQTEYRMSSSVCNLMDVEKNLYSSLSQEPKSRRYRLAWDQHEKGLYKEAAAELRAQSLVPLEGPLTLSQLLEAYEKELQAPGFFMNRLEDPVLTAAWAGKQELAQQLALKNASDWKDSIKNERQEIIERMFPRIDEWYEKLLFKISNRDRLHALIEEAVVKYKLEKLPYEDLIIDM